MDLHVRQLTEDVQPGQRLGRHVRHDPRSRSFAVAPSPIVTALHRRRVPIFDQGDVGSCTGNALAGALSTVPFTHRFTEPTAVRIYSAATRLDTYAGTYPPDDTGSDGLSVCKVALNRGWISRYEHAFDLNAALGALSRQPVIVGIKWLTGCDHPDSAGRIRYAGEDRGGHELEFVGVDAERREVRFAQSWGPGWGDHGYGVMSWDDFALALDDEGDVTVPIR